MCAILVINLSISVVSNVQCLWSNTTAQRGHHIHIITLKCNGMEHVSQVASTFIKWTVNCNYCCAIVHYKKCQPRKVGGTKHRASPPLQKVGGTCPPVHPRIYAHAGSRGQRAVNGRCCVSIHEIQTDISSSLATVCQKAVIKGVLHSFPQEPVALSVNSEAGGWFSLVVVSTWVFWYHWLGDR